MSNQTLSPPPDSSTPFAAPAWQGWFSSLFQRFALKGSYTVATLPGISATQPLGPPPGSIAYASNGRKVGEGAGSGTGVPVYYSNGAWRVFSTDAAVAA